MKAFKITTRNRTYVVKTLCCKCETVYVKSYSLFSLILYFFFFFRSTDSIFLFFVDKTVVEEGFGKDTFMLPKGGTVKTKQGGAAEAEGSCSTPF